ncbi:SusC/RagA family TonB-linked outer membrane protein [Pedobacter nyackensis]|uniref:SusC/RagA family TonB-linked outer membrane protein n=1 Tax=Pedobacter nyackensis TaxID=475255 RepID=UPI00292EFDF3|nr:SusC/RagA family TonB-linked outer membrane protein [Pedobacter nyackensis]
MIKNFTSYVQFKRPFGYLAYALMVVFLQLPQLLKANEASVSGKLFFQETVTVKGTVKDATDGLPLPGVTITDQEKKVLGVTDGNGVFNLKVAKGTEVSFNMLGYATVKNLISANQDNLSISLSSSSKELNEVVVTALGIKREEKALGYSVGKVTNEDLTNAMSNNWTNALTGKVAGLNLVKSGGGPAGTNKIVLRGENSLGGSSEALIVIDGVITSASSGRSTGTGSGAYLSAESPADFGNGLADINPDDIESVSVLKGPAATALYGYRGGNGAVIITTKSGMKRKGVGITLNSNTSFETINRWPDYQYEYGQGDAGQDLYYSYLATADGASTRSTSSAWGPKFDGQSYFQYDPVTRTTSATRLPWVAYPNNRKDFFNTANTFINSLSLDGGNDKNTARLSVTNLKNKWIVPNTGYNRNTVSLSLNSKFNDKLQIASKVNYNNKFSDNLPSTGYNNQTIMYFLRGMTPNMNIDWFKDYWVPGEEGLTQTRPFSSLLDNPYLIANEMLNKSNRNQVTGNVSATYNFLKNLSLMVRTAVDLSYESRSQQRPFSTNRYATGMYRTQNIFSQEVNSDFLLKYDNKIGSKLEYSITGGGSRMMNRYKKDELRADQLLYPNIFTFANSKNQVVALPYTAEYAVNSLYALGTLSYDNFLYMDVTARNDWGSTLATPTSTDNVSFFYPSVSLSAILSEKIKLPEFISFLKLRASIADVGSGGITPYYTDYVYDGSLFPGSLRNPTMISNSNLKPLKTLSKEFGVDVKFLNNRLNLDVTVYQSNTYNQIISSPIDRATGYSSIILNAGEIQNKGVEVQLSGKPIVNKEGFNMEVYGTFSLNRNKVIELQDSISTYVMSSGPRGTVEARVGGSLGDLYGLGYERSPDGQIVYNGGYPVLGLNSQKIGNTTSPYKASMGVNFSYKRFRFNALFDGQFGGVAYSLTHSVLAEEGKLKKTIPGRYNGILGNGVVKNADGSYSPNTVVSPIAAAYYKAHFNRDNVESNTFSTNFIKFREARFDYSLSPKMISKLGLEKASIGVYGRDLFVFTKWPVFDPEFGTIGGNGEITQGFETGQFPSTRTFGLNITVGF